MTLTISLLDVTELDVGLMKGSLVVRRKAREANMVFTNEHARLQHVETLKLPH